MSAFELALIASILLHAYVQPMGGNILLLLAICFAVASAIRMVLP